MCIRDETCRREAQSKYKMEHVTGVKSLKTTVRNGILNVIIEEFHSNIYPPRKKERLFPQKLNHSISVK